MTGNHFDGESLPDFAGDVFAGMKVSTHDEKATWLAWGASGITQSSPGQLLGKERVASLVRASEHADVKPVAGRTLFCWQRVFLLSLRLLQFGLVKGCDLRDVWFVTHVCRRSSRDKPQLEQQAVMRT